MTGEAPLGAAAEKAEAGSLPLLGVISGTSMDGIDVALIHSDGRRAVRPRGGATYPYPPRLREALIALIARPEQAATAPLSELEAAVTDAHAEAALRFLAERGLAPASVALLGLHGQTVFHDPRRGLTRQLGDGARAAARAGIDTVSGFRLADVAAGGEGAPLAPLYHAALAAGLPGPLAILNWGGVGNVTYLDGDTILAFDTGPASALLDDVTRARTGAPYDAGGALAARGRADAAVVAALLADPFFVKPPPKSLDRQQFHHALTLTERLGTEDALATLAAFTVGATAAARAILPRPPARWLVTGGGRHNATLMAGLAAAVGVPVAPVESVGWNGDHLEAECFAYLALRSRLGLPLSLPGTTGVPHPLTGGTFHPAPRTGRASTGSFTA